ncbi:LuxR family transcriptional regulator [Streptomyces zinciresistens K42]|uniref:LuxR family transcriptional regulator n=1 Tax=Streptomyces zinciresistens K42 TaxID=700597 RepID=G2G4Q8_9ACTN|nr:LuxR C-terminal-related transcriptional regulator [Streptomyces zinciresistens]EGX61531.1 LuxR family transcriptional regulator [Streptomyces zinciresistens K42]
MASLDAELNIEAANSDFFHHIARPSQEVCGQSIYDVLHPSARNILPKHFSHLSDGHGGRFVENVVAKRGHDRVFSTEITGIAIRGEGDAFSGVVILMTPEDDPSDAAPAAKSTLLLTALDARILEGIATGASTVQMASRLYLSRQGVEYHVGLMLRRFKAPNRATLVSRAYSMGVFTVGSWPPRVLPDFVK